MTDATQYLNLYDLFVNQIVGVGNVGTFIVLSFVVVAFLAARYRFPNSVTISIFALYGLLMGVFFPSILAFTLWVVGALFAWSISRLMSRG